MYVYFKELNGIFFYDDIVLVLKQFSAMAKDEDLTYGSCRFRRLADIQIKFGENVALLKRHVFQNETQARDDK